ncbi:hypothetical protein BCV71DRAFT_272167 [Rhizopus microsporus]|uniref:Uncharacterized protein n=1 Tax=Rhizopus microsporus TaxID=58291 RepID=A0A1X0RW00_RHIZD|nr:hypothetical protein BCV71DRAFT_272167 [Rhizopus microsporus]
MSTDEEQLKLMIETLQEQIKQNQELNNEKITAMQLDNSNFSNIQARLETQIYNQDQEISNLKKEIQQLSKAKRDMEKKMTVELQEFEKDRLNWQQREADLYNQIRALSIAEPRTPRTPRRRSVTLSPFGLGDIEENKENSASANTLSAPKLASPSYAREAKIAQRTIKAQDKLIADLKIELEKQKTMLQEHKNQVQNQSLRIEHLEHEIANVKQVNRSLMEDNESYQILLHEKTMTGEFMMNPIMQVRYNKTNATDQKQNSNSSTSNGLNLAAELNMASEWNQNDSQHFLLELTEENKLLQETNRALQLYINKILMRIIDNKQLEDVLSIDQPKKEEKKPIVLETPKPTTPSNDTKATANRQRRRTISYWGSKPVSKPAVPSTTSTQDGDEKRRHSSIMSSPSTGPQPERSVSTTTNGGQGTSGWARALRRMSVIGWGPKESDTTPQLAIHNDSAVFSSSEEDSSADNSRKSHSSGSSTPSIRRSNELGTLQEE